MHLVAGTRCQRRDRRCCRCCRCECHRRCQCCVSLFNVLDAELRRQAVDEAARGEIEAAGFVPEEKEEESESEESEHEEDEDKDELDVMKERQYGNRKSERKREAPNFGYQISSSQVALSGDSS